MPLTLSHREERRNAVIATTGELDLASAPDLSALADELMRNGVTNIIVDAESLTFCDSSGLRVLVSIANDLQRTGGRVAIVNAQPTVRRVLELTGLGGRILIADSVADARTTLNDAA